MRFIKFIVILVILSAIVVLAVNTFYLKKVDTGELPGIQPTTPIVVERLPGMERVSPGDHVKEEQITVTRANVVLDIQDAAWSRFTDTNSMDPVFDVGNNAIKLTPKDTSEIYLGDIISYQSRFLDGTIIHRVVKIAEDELGWYCLAKGDNNLDYDPGRIRFDQIKYLLVSIVY